MTSIFNKFYRLYFRPSQFFLDTNLLQKRWLIVLATAFYSVIVVFERIEQKVIRYDMVNVPESKEALLNTIVTSWFVFWSVSLVIGFLFAWLLSRSGPANEVSDLIFLLGANLFYIQRNKNVKRQDKYIYYYWSSDKPPYS